MTGHSVSTAIRLLAETNIAEEQAVLRACCIQVIYRTTRHQLHAAGRNHALPRSGDGSIVWCRTSEPSGKLAWYGRISRQNSLAKITLQDTVEGKRRGRPKKSWLDNTKDCTKHVARHGREGIQRVTPTGVYDTHVIEEEYIQE